MRWARLHIQWELNRICIESEVKHFGKFIDLENNVPVGDSRSATRPATSICYDQGFLFIVATCPKPNV